MEENRYTFKMKVFIENEAGSDQKNIFNEKTLEYRKTVKVSALYPFPYGFLLNTISGDGDALDCFVLTRKSLESRELLEVEPIGMFEDFEDGKEDHKILAVPLGETWDIDEKTQEVFRAFTVEVFAHLPDKTKVVGRFFGKAEALELIKRSQN